MTPFTDLDLRPELLLVLEQIGFTHMTPIQAEALPMVLSGADVTGQAETGSGKTAAFGLGLLNRIDVERAWPQAMVLCPTRELAEQVTMELRRLGSRLENLRVLTLCGGRSFQYQRDSLRRGCTVVVGTPGRVDEHLRRESLGLQDLRILVLDEADRMLDMGFIDVVTDIVGACPRDRQTLLFSATFPDAIDELAAEIQDEPIRVSVSEDTQPETITQSLVICEMGQRKQRIADVLAHYAPTSALVFCETRKDCAEVARSLSQRGAAALALHGDLDQRQRDDVLVQFANGSATVLVATNVAARGLDIPELPLVLVAELSSDPESHVHRVGRTGRAGESGRAVSIVSRPNEHKRLETLEAFLGEPLTREPELPVSGRLDSLTPHNRTLLLLAGRAAKLRKGDVLGALIKDGGIPKDAIGRIDTMDKTTAVAITREWADKALDYVMRGRIKKQRIRAVLL